MSKVITFSRVFPSYHPKAGQPTDFVEKLYNSFNIEIKGVNFFMPFEEELSELNKHLHYEYYDVYMEFRDTLKRRVSNDFAPKHHTIRAGKRWKVGDKFSPRVWSGKPYMTKQIVIAPDIEIVKIWDFVYNGISRPFFKINGEGIDTKEVERLAKNDGLTRDDLHGWFYYPHNRPFFEGQIICWNSTINY